MTEENKGKNEKGEGKKKLIDVNSKYKLSGKLLNQNEIDDMVKKFKKKKG